MSLFQSGRGFWRSFIWINGHTWPSIPPTVGSFPRQQSDSSRKFYMWSRCWPWMTGRRFARCFPKKGMGPTDVFRGQTWTKSTLKAGGQLWISHYSIQIGLGCGFLHWYPEFSSPSIVAMALPWRFPVWACCLFFQLAHCVALDVCSPATVADRLDIETCNESDTFLRGFFLVDIQPVWFWGFQTTTNLIDVTCKK